MSEVTEVTEQKRGGPTSPEGKQRSLQNLRQFQQQPEPKDELQEQLDAKREELAKVKAQMSEPVKQNIYQNLRYQENQLLEQIAELQERQHARATGAAWQEVADQRLRESQQRQAARVRGDTRIVAAATAQVTADHDAQQQQIADIGARVSDQRSALEASLVALRGKRRELAFAIAAGTSAATTEVTKVEAEILDKLAQLERLSLAEEQAQIEHEAVEAKRRAAEREVLMRRRDELLKDRVAIVDGLQQALDSLLPYLGQMADNSADLYRVLLRLDDGRAERFNRWSPRVWDWMAARFRHYFRYLPVMVASRAGRTLREIEGNELHEKG